MFSSLVFELSFSSTYTVFAGVSVTSSNTGVPDISGSVYTKTQVMMDLKCLPKYFNSFLTGSLFDYAHMVKL